jgi:flagellar biosynthesis/type III secretory pathway M-ring protein FliF/YscJ
MNKNKDKASQENADREERMDKIRNLISDQSKDAAKVLKVWLTKSLDNSKKNK